jgi:hypothetical protein
MDSGTGTWGLGLGAWDSGPGTRGLGLGAWDLGPGTWGLGLGGPGTGDLGDSLERDSAN